MQNSECKLWPLLSHLLRYPWSQNVFHYAPYSQETMHHFIQDEAILNPALYIFPFIWTFLRLYMICLDHLQLKLLFLYYSFSILFFHSLRPAFSCIPGCRGLLEPIPAVIGRKKVYTLRYIVNLWKFNRHCGWLSALSPFLPALLCRVGWPATPTFTSPACAVREPADKDSSFSPCCLT